MPGQMVTRHFRLRMYLHFLTLSHTNCKSRTYALKHWNGAGAALLLVRPMRRAFANSRSKGQVTVYPYLR